MEILQIGFIGFGLIGGSIAKALRAYRPQCRMIATSRSLSPLYQAQKDGVLDEITDCVNEQFSGCDIIFICTPVVTITKYFELLKPLIKSSCILTDVGSVKESIYTAAKNAGLENNFIGGHPMAGSEQSGYTSAHADLLCGAKYVITPSAHTSKEHLDSYVELVKISRPCQLSWTRQHMITVLQLSAMCRTLSLPHWQSWLKMPTPVTIKITCTCLPQAVLRTPPGSLLLPRKCGNRFVLQIRRLFRSF